MPLESWQRFQHGLCVVEAKRWNRVLDREETRRRGEEGVPSTQMLRYLRRVDDDTKGALRWGILTNGRHWQLYFWGALSVAENFLEIDLGKALALPGCELELFDKPPEIFAGNMAAWRSHTLKLFILLFSWAAFLADQGEPFHHLALREGQQWESRVARDLSNTVFDQVVPALGQALASADGRTGELDASQIDEVRQGALVLLYRLLFVLYTEDRTLPGGLILNPGSVGCPAYDDPSDPAHVSEAGSPHARYALLDLASDQHVHVELIALEYPCEDAARRAEANGRPDWAHGLRTGFVRA